MLLILTYAKVCTTSLHSLLAERFTGDVFRSHGLEQWILDPLERFLTVSTANTAGLRASFDNAPIRERLAHARATGEMITIISGVRDPIERSLSVAMQNLDVAFADCLSSSAEASAQAVAERVSDLWLHDAGADDASRAFLQHMIRAPLMWFEEELDRPFGFDLREHPFDRTQGYSIQSKDNVRLLLFRHENAPTAIENGLAALFPGMVFSLSRENTGLDKPTADIYRALKACFRLPRSALEAIYAHPDVSQYYSEEEIAVAIDRWAEAAPRAVWGAPLPPAAPRAAFAATVFIPLHNNARYIGAQLDSLMAQWRPDVELLVIDDGSQDDSLAAALDSLAKHPEIALTVMRNSNAIGHGMLPTIANLAKAPLLIQSDSDDVALPGRLDTTIDHFRVHPDCKLLTSNAVLLSEGGIPIRLLDTEWPDAVLDDAVALVEQQHAPYWLGAASAFHRSIIDAFQPFDPDLCAYGFDLITGFRALLLGSQHYLARPLVGWRQHSRNSHRLIGSHSQDPKAREHVAAMFLMARAQRMRDVAWLCAQGKLEPARAVEIEACWKEDFIASSDTWIRARNRVTGSRMASTPPAGTVVSPDVYVPPIPPILTLMRGREYPVEQIGPALALWSGMHAYEGACVWTSRQAIVVLRIPDQEAQALVLTLAGLPYVDRQIISVSLDFARPVEVTVIAGQTRRVIVPIKQRRDPVNGFVTLIISVPEATQPIVFDPATNDARVLGVMLFSLQVQ